MVFLLQSQEANQRQFHVQELAKDFHFFHMMWNSSMTMSTINWHAFDGALVNHVTCHVVENYVKDFIGIYETLVKSTNGGG